MTHFRPATISEYAAFMDLYVADDGFKNIEAYDTNTIDRVVYALRDFRLYNDCGAAARNIIIPEDVHSCYLGRGRL